MTTKIKTAQGMFVERESHRGGLIFSGVMAGVSVVALIHLMPKLDEGHAFVVMFLSFIISACSFIMSSMGFFATLEWLNEYRNSSFTSRFYYIASMTSFVIGLFSFVTGLGAIGFVHSTWMGAISCAGATCVMAHFAVVIRTLGEEPAQSD